MSKTVPVVEASALVKGFGSAPRGTTAVSGVSLQIQPGETLGLVGESGSGKSTLGRLLVRLLDPDAGQVQWEGVPASRLRAGALRAARRRMQMVFQDPAASLNPRMTVGGAVMEGIRCLGRTGAREARRGALRLLERVGLDRSFFTRFPWELSGGQAQRTVLSVEPKFLVLDEPFSALDSLTSAEVLNLLLHLQEAYGVACLFITHDLGILGHLADRIAVMQSGEVVETAPASELFQAPRHACTRRLLASVPGQGAFAHLDPGRPGYQEPSGSSHPPEATI